MVILGLSEKETLLIFYGIAVLGSIFAILMQNFQDYSLLLFGGFGIVLILVGIYLAHVKTETSNKTSENTISWLPNKYKATWYKRNVAEMLLDVIVIVFCFYGSYLLRFEGNLTGSPSRAILAALPWVVVGSLFSLIMAGVYRSRWRFISIAEIPIFVYGVIGGTIFSLAIVTLLSRFGEGHSRSAFVIFGFLLFTGLVGSRLSFRWLDFILVTKKKKTIERKKSILIYGSGKEAKLLHEALSLDPKIDRYEIVGFIDCEGEAAGSALCGLPIKTESEWLQFFWQSKPRIFIPPSLLADELADELAQKWERKGVVYRFQVMARPVRFASQAVPHLKDGQ
jgi:FlaA1/EpsC-like NDP-sugar epimerase